MSLTGPQPAREEQLCVVVHGSHEVAALAGDLKVKLGECELAAKQDIPGPDLLLMLGSPLPEQPARAWQATFAARTLHDLPTQEQLLAHRGDITRVTILITAPLLYAKGCWYVSGVYAEDGRVETQYFPLVKLASQLAPAVFTSARLLFHPARCEPSCGHTPLDSPDDRALQDLERELNALGAPRAGNGRITPMSGPAGSQPALGVGARWACRLTAPAHGPNGAAARLVEVPLYWLQTLLDGCKALEEGSLEASRRVGLVSLEPHGEWCLRLTACLRELGFETAIGSLEAVVASEPHAILVLEDLALWPRTEVLSAVDAIRAEQIPILLLALEPPPAEPTAGNWRMQPAKHRGPMASVQQALWLAGRSGAGVEMSVEQHHKLLDTTNAAVETFRSDEPDLWKTFITVHCGRAPDPAVRPYFELGHSVSDLWDRAVKLLSFLDGKDHFDARASGQVAALPRTLLRMLAQLRRTRRFKAAARLCPRIDVLLDPSNAGEHAFRDEAEDLYRRLAEEADCSADLPIIERVESGTIERVLGKGRLVVYVTRGAGAPPPRVVTEKRAGRLFVALLGTEPASEAWTSLVNDSDHADDAKRLWHEINDYLDRNRVFIVHASADLTRAHRLVADLESKGYLCWLAPREGVADRIEPMLRRYLERCACAVVLMTEGSARSSWVREELTHLGRLEPPGERFIGVELPNPSQSPRFDEWKRLFFGGSNGATWNDGSNDHIKVITRWLVLRKVQTIVGR